MTTNTSLKPNRVIIEHKETGKTHEFDFDLFSTARAFAESKANDGHNVWHESGIGFGQPTQVDIIDPTRPII